MRVGAEIDHVLELAPEIGLAAVCHQVSVLGAHHDGDLALGLQRFRNTRRHHAAAIQLHHGLATDNLGDLALDEIGLADEVGHEAHRGAVVDVARGADLQDLALAHDRDAVRHGEGFLLVMGHEDEGDAGFMLQALQLDLHVLAELVVQGRERLVEEQNLGCRGERPGQRHALLLAARDLAGAAIGEFLHAHEP